VFQEDWIKVKNPDSPAMLRALVGVGCWTGRYPAIVNARTRAQSFPSMGNRCLW
jgi:hypothetical protein